MFKLPSLTCLKGKLRATLAIVFPVIDGSDAVGNLATRPHGSGNRNRYTSAALVDILILTELHCQPTHPSDSLRTHPNASPRSLPCNLL